MAKQKGYILIDRNIMDSWLWDYEPYSRAQAWIDLLFLARYQENSTYISIRNNDIEIKHGEVCWSQEALGKRWKWSKKKVVSYLKKLEKELQITLQKTAAIHKIEIINYSKYQKKEPQTALQTALQKNHRRTTEAPHTKERKERKERKEGNKEKLNKKEIQKFDDDLESEKEFQEFWRYYRPVKVSDGRMVNKGDKKRGAFLYQKFMNEGVSHGDIMKGLHNYLTECVQNDTLTKAAPTFLFNRVWERFQTNQQQPAILSEASNARIKANNQPSELTVQCDRAIEDLTARADANARRAEQARVEEEQRRANSETENDLLEDVFGPGFGRN